MSSQPDGPDIEKAVSHTEQQENVNSEVATPPVVARIDDDFKFTFSKWLALLVSTRRNQTRKVQY